MARVGNRALLEHRGVQVEVDQRRRYANTTYTWLRFLREGKDTGWNCDPWPCVTPKRAEVVQAIDDFLARESAAVIKPEEWL